MGSQWDQGISVFDHCRIVWDLWKDGHHPLEKLCDRRSATFHHCRIVWDLWRREDCGGSAGDWKIPPGGIAVGSKHFRSLPLYDRMGSVEGWAPSLRECCGFEAITHSIAVGSCGIC